ncbi:hypothetical protein MLD38_008712 [Melastoma candidum]|uniref:Uncharacterized protein n=1 Tax=Melastoma candidum TaxID=119954 RepID=A0ACB9RUV0_9MYRT|nr:hypothetical protein MLD38_008712 [Melastoma candidum]
MSEHPMSYLSLSLSLSLLLLSFLLPSSSLSASNQTLIPNPYFQPHNLLVTSRPFKLSPGTSLSSYIAFSFSPNATHTHLAILLFSSKFLPLSGPGSGNPVPSEERLVGVVFDARANNVGVCVGSVDPSVVRDLGSVGLAIGGGEKLRSWVDYDASSKELEVRVQKSGSEDRPYEPVLAHPVNFSRLWGDGANLMLGISSVSESSSKDGGNDVVGSGNVNVFSWEYRVRELPSSMHSMPVDPSRFPIEHHAVPGGCTGYWGSLSVV